MTTEKHLSISDNFNTRVIDKDMRIFAETQNAEDAKLIVQAVNSFNDLYEAGQELDKVMGQTIGQFADKKIISKQAADLMIASLAPTLIIWREAIRKADGGK